NSPVQLTLPCKRQTKLIMTVGEVSINAKRQVVVNKEKVLTNKLLQNEKEIVEMQNKSRIEFERESVMLRRLFELILSVINDAEVIVRLRVGGFLRQNPIKVTFRISKIALRSQQCPQHRVRL